MKTIEMMLIVGAGLCVQTSVTVEATNVWVSGYARGFMEDKRLPNANVSTVAGEPFLQTTTDANGRFNVSWVAGTPITLQVEREGYPITIGPTIIVPDNGLSGVHHEYIFQVPTNRIFGALWAVLPSKPDPTKCHIVVTVAAANVTIDSSPQGEANSTVHLTHPTAGNVTNPYYFGITKSGKTDPFSRGLNMSSADGGVVFFNVEPQTTPYTVVAHKDMHVFSKLQAYCFAGKFTNGAPPLGPTVIGYN
eukprot:m.27533 g.27533  ORF g.27533 m.27533 type:complete len:249 (-) comp15764_c0_seq1:142-888(-)